jgi:hypothetical protein
MWGLSGRLESEIMERAARAAHIRFETASHDGSTMPTQDGPILLPFDASDEDILSVVMRWCDKLVAQDYAGAISILLQSAWTPELLKTAIETIDGWDDSGPPHHVTPPETATFRPDDEPQNNAYPRLEVDRSTLPDGSSYISVWFDLPLDGFWSDLTATFDVDATDGGLGLTLDQVHVM